MKILLVSVTGPPKNSPESLQVGRYIYELGKHHQVSLLTSDKMGGWEPNDASLEYYLAHTKNVIRVRVPWLRGLSILKKIAPTLFFPDDYTWFLRNLKIDKLDANYDVIYTRSAPITSALAGLKISQKKGIPLVTHFSDPWVDNPFLKLSDRQRRKHEELEKLCFTNSKAITVTSNKTLEFYRKKYPMFADKFFFLPNVFGKRDRKVVGPQQKSRIRIIYTGRLYGSRSVKPLLVALDRLNSGQLAKIEIIFAGFCDEVNAHLLTNTRFPIKYVGHLPNEEAVKLLYTADILLSIDSLEEDPRMDLFFPSKLLDYMATGKPILAITNKTSTTQEVIDGKFGYCFSKDQLTEMAETIIDLSINLLENKPIPLLEKGVDEYSVETNVVRLENVLNFAIG